MIPLMTRMLGRGNLITYATLLLFRFSISHCPTVLATLQVWAVISAAVAGLVPNVRRCLQLDCAERSSAAVASL
jgi:hypothetical protein